MTGEAGEAEQPGRLLIPPNQEAPEVPATLVNTTAEPPLHAGPALWCIVLGARPFRGDNRPTDHPPTVGS